MITKLTKTGNGHYKLYLQEFFTARKRSLRRLCVYTCLSVILFAGGWRVWQGAYMAGWACVVGAMVHPQK